jgi:hypothetical protein
VARSLNEARREAAERLDLQVDAVTRDPHDGEMNALISIADGTLLRGIPALSRHGGSSAILGTEPGTDAHLDRLDQLG